MSQWLGIFCLVASLIILWQIREMLLLVFAAVVVATTLNGLVRRLQKAGLPRNVAVPLTLAAVVLAVILFFGLLVPPFIDQFSQLVGLLPRAISQILSRLEGAIAQRPAWLPQLTLPDPAQLAQQLQPLAQDVLGNFLAFFSNSLSALFEVLLVMVLTVMLLTNPGAYRQTFLRLFPSFYRRRADEILVKCEISLGNWMGGLIISSSLVAALSFAGLWLLGIPLVLAHALLAGVLNFIPNLGPTLSTVFPLTVALLDTPWKAIAVLGLYIVIQNLESYFLTPTIMAQQVSLLPAFVLAAQIFFASFFGFLGLLLALPLTVVARTWIEEVLIKDVLDRWTDDEPQPTPVDSYPPTLLTSQPSDAPSSENGPQEDSTSESA